MTLKVSHTIPGMQKEAAQKMDEISAVIGLNELFNEVGNETGLP